jgi:uncharacterized protein YqeY
MLKEKIQVDFIVAIKAKDEKTKIALSGIKAKITEAEKTKGNVELSDDEVIKVITSGIKQRKQSVDEFTRGNRQDLADKELGEIEVLEKYLPKQMTSEEVEFEVKKILSGFELGLNKQRLVGQTIGTFNKNFTGRANSTLVSQIVANLTINY